MLRITTISTAAGQRWILCGRLTGRWVRELRLNWEHVSISSPVRRRVIDLADVTFVDESGESLLRELKRDGAVFTGNCGVDVRHIVENLGDDSKPAVRKYLGCPE